VDDAPDPALGCSLGNHAHILRDVESRAKNVRAASNPQRIWASVPFYGTAMWHLQNARGVARQVRIRGFGALSTELGQIRLRLVVRLMRW
jgi:hypothetical protein